MRRHLQVAATGGSHLAHHEEPLLLICSSRTFRSSAPLATIWKFEISPILPLMMSSCRLKPIVLVGLTIQCIADLQLLPFMLVSRVIALIDLLRSKNTSVFLDTRGDSHSTESDSSLHLERKLFSQDTHELESTSWHCKTPCMMLLNVTKDLNSCICTAYLAVLSV